MVVTVSAEPLPSACILMFWFRQDVSGQSVGEFPPANESAQVRVEVDKTHRLDVIQTAEYCRCRRSSVEKEIQPKQGEMAKGVLACFLFDR